MVEFNEVLLDASVTFTYDEVNEELTLGSLTVDIAEEPHDVSFMLDNGHVRETIEESIRDDD